MPAYNGGKALAGKAIHERIITLEKELCGTIKMPLFVPFSGLLGVTRHFSKLKNRDIFVIL
jgi:hypothetical protein